MSYSRKDVEKFIIEILTRYSDNGILFEELRNELESMGIYIDGLFLRKTIADMIRNGIICKEVSSSKKRFYLILCRKHINNL
ncbi:MAG: hypothetical protein QXG46_01965 [Ignisphaera sp.]